MISFSQHEADYWPFGYGSGINFYAPAITNDSSSLNAYEGCSVISDGCGILFYTDGDTVFNRNHIPMPNGFDLAGECFNYGEPSNTQGALIVSQPGSDSIFYIFTTDCIEDTLADGMRYSIVDMSLDNGNGDVTIKNQLLMPSSTEKLTATRHQNSCDVWILGHEYGNDAFHAFLLSNSGIIGPIISNTGQIHDYNNQCGVFPCINEQIARGYMKFSSDGTKLVLVSTPDDYDINVQPVYGLYPEIFTFDKSSGIVTSDLVLNDSTYLYYGASFSPDNSILYLSCAWYGYNYSKGYLHQYDLSSGSPATIINSIYLVNDTIQHNYYPGALQLGYDGKIYAANDYSNYISTINNPNNIGVSCAYQDTAHNLGPNHFCGVGLPNLMESYFLNDQEADFSASTSTAQVGDTIYFLDNSINPNSWEWDFGDGAISFSQNPYHVYNLPGIYQVELTINKECHYDRQCFTVEITDEHNSITAFDPNSILIYPNPINDKLIFESPFVIENPKFKIVNSLGQIVYFVSPDSNSSFTFNLNLPAGVYYLILDSDYQQATWKVVQQ
ncbi:MAG: T9SS type A sorting domain-containing protein [Crocinitomicaceae bacterium]|nr:T9SS type A sorting domain-containing protein [Crocinitomicaceae bacterium]